MIWIGIDPGVNTGVAVWDGAALRYTSLDTVPLHRALDTVRSVYEAQGGNVTVVFEDARQRKWIPREKSIKEFKGRAMGAGSVRRDATIWEEALTDWGIPFRAEPPRPGLTKWKPDYFAHVTGWKGRTSEHARDAALLVFGRC